MSDVLELSSLGWGTLCGVCKCEGFARLYIDEWKIRWHHPNRPYPCSERAPFYAWSAVEIARELAGHR